MLRFPAKRLRAEAIVSHMREAGLERAVCFSCGNASRELKELLRDSLVDIAPGGMLEAGRWMSTAEIRRVWPGHFDATSGHLPPDLMNELARIYRLHLGPALGKAAPIYVPTGSGETLVALSIAYPDAALVAVYGEGSATVFNARAPLNKLVAALAVVQHGTEPDHG